MQWERGKRCFLLQIISTCLRYAYWKGGEWSAPCGTRTEAVKKYCRMVAPDLVAHVAVGEVEAGEHHRLQLRLLGNARVHAVSHLHTQFILDFCHPKIIYLKENNT
jgi:hypothetical protein